MKKNCGRKHVFLVNQKYHVFISLSSYVTRSEKRTYDPKNQFSDCAWFYFDLTLYEVQSEIFHLHYFGKKWIIERVFERVRSGSSFFNRSACKFPLLDRRFLFSNHVSYYCYYFITNIFCEIFRIYTWKYNTSISYPLRSTIKFSQVFLCSLNPARSHRNFAWDEIVPVRPRRIIDHFNI